MANHGIQIVMSGSQTVTGIADQTTWLSDIQRHLFWEKLRQGNNSQETSVFSKLSNSVIYTTQRRLKLERSPGTCPRTMKRLCGKKVHTSTVTSLGLLYSVLRNTLTRAVHGMCMILTLPPAPANAAAGRQLAFLLSHLFTGASFLSQYLLPSGLLAIPSVYVLVG